MFIFFDTETTGLEYKDQIIQLSYIITDDKFDILEAKNYFFDVDVEIAVEATQVHGIDKEKLLKLSGGNKFKDYAKDILWDFQNAKVISHNIDFDTRFLKMEFERIGKGLSLNKTFCTMKNYEDVLEIPHHYYGIKWPKLSEVVEYIQLDINNLKMKAIQLFGETGEFHDARLDVYSTYEIYKALRECVMTKHIGKVKEQISNLVTESNAECVDDIVRELSKLRDIVNLIDDFEGKKEQFIRSYLEPSGFANIDDDDIPF